MKEREQPSRQWLGGSGEDLPAGDPDEKGLDRWPKGQEREGQKESSPNACGECSRIDLVAGG